MGFMEMFFLKKKDMTNNYNLENCRSFEGVFLFCFVSFLSGYIFTHETFKQHRG